MENDNVKKINNNVYVELNTIVSMAEKIADQYRNNPYLSDGAKQGADSAISNFLAEIRCIDHV
jgi:hypothetical protein